MSEAKVRRVMMESDHDNQKWYVIEGYMDGCPDITKRETINLAALASGDVVLADRVAKMKADVAEYHARWLYLQTLTDL